MTNLNLSRNGGDSPLFFYSAKTQFSNAGDALINRELISLLRERGSIVAISGGAPAKFLAEIDLRENEVISGKEVQLILRALLNRLKGNCVYLIQTPGDIGPGGGAGPAIVRAVLVPMLAMFGIRIIHIGASLSETSGIKLALLAWRSSFMQHTGLRDRRSLDTATKWKFRNVNYFPDLAFNVESFPQYQEYMEDERPKGLRLALSFRGDKFSLQQQDAILAVLQKSIAKLPLVSSVKVVVQVDMDLSFAHRIKGALARWDPELVHTLSIETLRGLYSMTDVVLTNRLHVLLLAGLSGAAPFAMVDAVRNKKIVGLLEGLGLEDLLCDVADHEFLAQFVPQINNVRRRISAIAVEQKRKIESALGDIFSKPRRNS